MKHKFISGSEKVSFDFHNLPTPMVSYSGTAKELHALLFKAALGADEPAPSPAVDEIAREIAEAIRHKQRTMTTYRDNVLVPIIQPILQAHSLTLQGATVELISAITALLDTMETCHICKGALMLEESPVHCEDCSSACEGHEEPECTPIYVLHQAVRRALSALLAAPRSEWVRVQEAMPDYGTVSLVVCHVGDDLPYIDIATYSYYGGWMVGSNSDEKQIDPTVTHWQPLPEAPRNAAKSQQR